MSPETRNLNQATVQGNRSIMKLVAIKHHPYLRGDLTVRAVQWIYFDFAHPILFLSSRSLRRTLFGSSVSTASEKLSTQERCLCLTPLQRCSHPNDLQAWGTLYSLPPPEAGILHKWLKVIKMRGRPAPYLQCYHKNICLKEKGIMYPVPNWLKLKKKKIICIFPRAREKLGRLKLLVFISANKNSLTGSKSGVSIYQTS